MWEFVWLTFWFGFKMVFIGDFILIIGDIFLLISIIIILCYCLYINRYVKSLYISELSIKISLIPLVFLLIISIKSWDVISFANNLNLFISNLSNFFRILVIFLSFFCLLVSYDYFKKENIIIFEYPILFLLSLQGILLLLMVQDFFFLYLAIELQNLCFYVMAGLKKYSNLSTEAALKYYIMGALSSSLLLLGISLIYGILGTLNFVELSNLLETFDFLGSTYFLFLIACLFIVIALLFKLGVVPFHWWLPDVYEGSPLIVMMYFSIIPKISLIFILIKLYSFIFIYLYPFFNVLFLVTGLMSVILGLINAMYQFKIKRFLAYSAIANVGFMNVGLSFGTLEAIHAVFLYLIIYVFVLFGIFIFLLMIREQRTNNKLIELFDIAFIFKENKLLAVALSFLFFSLAGVPPFIGFFGKLFVFFSGITSFNYVIVFCLMLLSVFSAVYYIRVVRFLMFSGNTIKESLFLIEINKIFAYAFVFFVLINFLFFFFVDFFNCFLYNLLFVYYYDVFF